MRRGPRFERDHPESDAPPISTAIRAAAADWVARRDAGLSAREEIDYAAWLEADPAHRSAVRGLDFAWSTLDRPLTTGTADAVLAELTARARQRRRQRNVACGVASLVLLFGAGLGWQALRPASESNSPATASAAVLLPSIQALPDGSVTELRDGAEITVEFTDAQRRVVLRRGEAYFKVAKNATRPFVVAAGGVEVQAVGTAFSVDFGKSAVDVLVTEGKVAVTMAAAEAARIDPTRLPSEPLLIGAGHGATVLTSAPQPDSESRPVSDADVQSRLAWRSPRLEFSGTPLIEAVALLNRHNRVQFTIEDPGLARTRVSGIFGGDEHGCFCPPPRIQFRRPIRAARTRRGRPPSQIVERDEAGAASSRRRWNGDPRR
jgi:transmembrane sensor